MLDSGSNYLFLESTDFDSGTNNFAVYSNAQEVKTSSVVKGSARLVFYNQIAQFTDANVPYQTYVRNHCWAIVVSASNREGLTNEGYFNQLVNNDAAIIGTRFLSNPSFSGVHINSSRNEQVCFPITNIDRPTAGATPFDTKYFQPRFTSSKLFVIPLDRLSIRMPFILPATYAQIRLPVDNLVCGMAFDLSAIFSNSTNSIPPTADTASNQGVGGVGVFDAKVGTDFQFRNINVASTKLTVVLDAPNKEVDLDFGTVALNDLSDVAGAPANGQVLKYDTGTLLWGPANDIGEANTASNQGVGGVGLFDAKVGVDLQFRNINAGSAKITVALDAPNKEVDINIGTLNLDDLSNVNAPAPANGDALIYDTGTLTWINSAIGTSLMFMMQPTSTRSTVGPSTFAVVDATIAASPANWVGLTFVNNITLTSSVGSGVGLTNTGNSLTIGATAGAGTVKIHAKFYVDIPTGVNTWFAIDKADPGVAVIAPSIVWLPNLLIDRKGVCVILDAVYNYSGVGNVSFSINAFQSGASVLNVYSPTLVGELWA